MCESDAELSECGRQVEQLRRENVELESAYNELNNQYEGHKAQYGSIVDSNQLLSNRIGQ